MTILRQIAKRAATDALLPASLSVREEGGNNRGRWVAVILSYVGLPIGNPWCAAWTRLRLGRAADALGLSLPAGFPKSGLARSYVNWAKKTARWVPVAKCRAGEYRPKVGDLIVWQFAGISGHIGIVVKDGGEDGVYTVEANTDSGKPGVNRDGDGVYRKYRAWSSLGTKGGFVSME